MIGIWAPTPAAPIPAADGETSAPVAPPPALLGKVVLTAQKCGTGFSIFVKAEYDAAAEETFDYEDSEDEYKRTKGALSRTCMCHILSRRRL